MFNSCGRIERVPKQKSAAGPSNSVYKCEFCDDGWQSESEVYIHKRNHTEKVHYFIRKKKNICLLCIKLFNSKSSLIAHIKTDHLLSSENIHYVNRHIYVCDYCENIFFNKEMLIVHLAKVHKTQKKSDLVQCPLKHCRKWMYPAYLWTHFSVHQMQSIASCPACYKKCRDIKDLKVHMTTHPYDLQCYHCFTDFKNIQLYQQHLSKHSLQTEVTSYEDIPEEVYKKYYIPFSSDKIKWTYHRINPYIGLPLQQIKICVLCKKMCYNTEQMQSHVKFHQICKDDLNESTEDNITFYKCSQCGEKFDSKILLKQHVFKANCAGIVKLDDKLDDC